MWWDLLYWLLMAAIGAGLWLLWRGIKGKVVDTHPHCGHCGYDLFGLASAQRKHCPECGTYLITYTGIRRGQTRRLTHLIALAVAIIVLAWVGADQIRTMLSQRTYRALALLEAVRSGDLKSAQTLLRAHRSLILQSAPLLDDFEQDLTEAAARAGNAQIAALLVAADLDVHQRLSGERTWLHVAAESDDAATAQVLLGAGADPNARDALGQTPLHRAIGSPGVASLLLFHGADVNAPDASGIRPLDLASASRSGPTMAVLLENGASLRSNESGDMDLSAVATEIWDLVAASMLDPANPNRLATFLREHPEALTDDHGGGPLFHRAIAHRQYELAAFLLKQGASIDAADTRGRTALHTAAEQLNAGGVEFLLDHGADPNVATPEGLTPLHVAAAGEDPAIVRMLINAGAASGAADGAGDTPLAIAMRANRTGMVEMMREMEK